MIAIYTYMSVRVIVTWYVWYNDNNDDDDDATTTTTNNNDNDTGVG